VRAVMRTGPPWGPSESIEGPAPRHHLHKSTPQLIGAASGIAGLLPGGGMGLINLMLGTRKSNASLSGNENSHI